MNELGVIANPALNGSRPYAVPRAGAAIDLHLDANEGPTPPIDLLRVIEDVQTLRRYPSTDDLRDRLAANLRVRPGQIAVTAGGDDAIDRACRSVLAPGREIILTPPTFEMFHRYAALTGATERSVNWLSERFPIDAVLSEITDHTAFIALVTPNNPFGLAMTADDIRRVATAAPHALVVLDLAYTEFADEDLTPVGLEFPNVVCIRTLSKAWGLAGLRVGYAIGDERVINWIRAAGGPYAVSGPSAAIACRALETCAGLVRETVDTVRSERAELTALLRSLGAEPWESRANFVTARFPDAERVWRQLGQRGIAVRWFGPRPLLESCLRITCPGRRPVFERLIRALRESIA